MQNEDFYEPNNLLFFSEWKVHTFIHPRVCNSRLEKVNPRHTHPCAQHGAVGLSNNAMVVSLFYMNNNFSFIQYLAPHCCDFRRFLSLPQGSRRHIGTQSGHFGMDADSNTTSELTPMPKPCSAHQEMTNNHCSDFRLPARTNQT